MYIDINYLNLLKPRQRAAYFGRVNQKEEPLPSAFNAYGTAVQVYDVLDDGKAQRSPISRGEPCPRGRNVRTPAQMLCGMLCRCLYRHFYAIGQFDRRNLHFSVLEREFNGVIQQVHENLALLRVGPERRRPV